MRDNEQNWSNYWQGRDAHAEALVGIEKSHELAEFWKNALGGFDNNAEILDLACGAGSVLRHASSLGFANLSGVDISEHAINTMLEEFPNAKGYVAGVDDTNLASGSFDIIVSQFGFEYAGDLARQKKTCIEIARLLKEGGKFIALCHIKDGAISDEVALHLSQIKNIENTGFINAAKKLFTALDAVEKSASSLAAAGYRSALEKLEKPREELIAFIANNSGQIQSLAAHLLAGTGELFERRKAYDLSDITGWLDGMQSEINAYKGRMASQKHASLGEDDITRLQAVLHKHGMQCDKARTLTMENDDKPAAWILQAQKQAQKQAQN